MSYFLFAQAASPERAAPAVQKGLAGESRRRVDSGRLARYDSAVPRLRRRVTLIVAVIVVGGVQPAHAAHCERAVPGEFYVSHEAGASDDPPNDGSCEAPFRTIKRGLRELGPGKTLNLRGGVYLEPVLLYKRSGTDGHPITIRSYPGERASIDASLPRFRTLSDERWRPAKELDARAHPQEFVSRHRLKDPKNPVNRARSLAALATSA